jgi:RES domain-containing protein
MSTPLSAIGSIRRGGRFNPAHAFEILYVAMSPDTTLYEVHALLPGGVPKRVVPLVVFTI